MRHLVLGGLAATLLGVLAPPASACVPELPSARCGSIAAPLDRSHPELGTVTVSYAVVPRADQSRPSLGAIVPNPGGPSQVVIGQGAQYAEKLAPLLERRELVLIDPRGTGRSGALACSSLAGPLGHPPRHEWRSVPVDASFGTRAGLYGTAAAADDIEQVRAALGVEQLDLWGESYGTYLMQVYAARHPEHVHALVLSGAYPIDFDPWGRDRAAAARRGMRLVCARTRACDADVVLAQLARLAARLRVRPIAVTLPSGPAQVDEGALAELLFLGLFDRLPAVTESALDGDDAPLRSLFSFVRLLLTAPQPPSEASIAQRFAVMCHDYPRAYSYADAPAARRAAYDRALAALDPRDFAPFSPVGWTGAGFDGLDTCIEWPADPTATLPIDPRAMPAVPALILSGDLDTDTPSAGARVVASRFSRGAFMEVSNAAHHPTELSACAVEAGIRFVETRTSDPQACAHDGTPPQVLPRAPLFASGLPQPLRTGSPGVRRAVAVLAATATSLLEQLPVLEAWGTADGLRGGHFAASATGVTVERVQVVRDARVSGVFAGEWYVSGPGVTAGHLRVVPTDTGGAHLSGTLDGKRVNVSLGLG